MQFSKWHALGNSYVVIEREALGRPIDPVLAERLCDVRYGVGSDGVVEVLSVDGARAEIAIWNPDGSAAEFSGNGSRIAAGWLARRSGSNTVSIAVGGTGVLGGAAGGRHDRDRGRRRRGGRDRDGGARRRADRADRGVCRQPARGRAGGAGPGGAAPPRPAAGGERALSRPDERPARARRRAERGHGRRLGAWSGGDERLGLERRRRRVRRDRERLVREPGHRANAGRRASGRARRGERGRRSSARSRRSAKASCGPSRRPGASLAVRRLGEAPRPPARTRGASRSG